MIKVKQADEYVIAELIKSDVEINYDNFYKNDLITIGKVARILYKKEKQENKKLEEQNEFLMKQDNILQTLMQWLYKEKEKVIKTYLEKNISCPTIKQANFITICDVINKIKEIKENMK